MEEFDFNEYEAERFSAKMYLDTFTFDLYNSFEPSADKEIERLTNEIDTQKTKYKKLDSKEIKGKTEQGIMDIEVAQHYCLIDIEYIKEEIWALIEMKIIYAFKFLEINIKKLIRTGFSETQTKDFYKWDSLNSFLKGKNIKPYKLNGFQEVTQLKDVNNSLKHSGEFNGEIKKRIPEFRDKENITFYDLNLFYSRIKEFPKIYLGELASAIHTELYEFNEKKIDDIADDIACRMERKDAERLIKAIKSKY
jgi:hypothetical protein